LFGVTLEIVVVGVIVNARPFENTPLCCTVIVPDTAFAATVAVICVFVQLTTVQGVVPSHTAPVPRVFRKPVPVMVMSEPPGPEVGVTVVMVGGEARMVYTAVATVPLK
jgi:hypothetical protein